MEKKRKMPARAAARVEHVAKKRNSTPTDASTISAPPSTAASPQPASEAAFPDPPSISLPRALLPGHLLPTVEKPQSDDLSNKEFQSIQESGVIAESLSRSRQKWIHDGVFEKYWTKPSKRKGASKEDSNNPAKDTMARIGQVTLTIEPHVLEAILYTVKDPKPTPTTNSSVRPVLQYGPPNGAMPPPPKPTPAPTNAPTPSSSNAMPLSKPPVQGGQSANAMRPSPQPTPRKDEGSLPVQQLLSKSAPSSSQSHPPQQTQQTQQIQQTELQRPSLPTPMDMPVPSPRGLESVLAPPQPVHPRPSQPPAPSNHPLHAPAAPQTSVASGTSLPGGSTGATKPPHPAKPVQAPGPGADPIIVTLAERASEDPQLRDLMKRVAVGEAAPHELAHFQRIIDQITMDYKRKGGQQGPSADRLIVDGRTVKYFADEVKTILEIVLRSNPNQKSYNLRGPPGCDTLVLMLVGEALDKPNVKSLIQRVADAKPKFSDAVDLKALLDKLNNVIKRETEALAAASPPNPPAAQQAVSAPTKGEDSAKKPSASTSTQHANTTAPQQALRSKGPPVANKPDIAAIVLEFAGGTGDRYLFPKYSILEYSAEGTVVHVSFLIVRRGSRLEYGGDRTMDYYQAVTVRLQAQSPKILENLARVVAPQDEVRRYMDDVLDNMTRAEYVVLAMRLPKPEKEETSDEGSSTPRISEPSRMSQPPSVMWDNRSASNKSSSGKSTAKTTSEDEAYMGFIATVT